MKEIFILLLLLLWIYTLSLLFLRIFYRRRLLIEQRYIKAVKNIYTQKNYHPKKRPLKLTEVDWEHLLHRLSIGKSYVNMVDFQLERGNVNLRVNEFVSIVMLFCVVGGFIGYIFFSNFLGSFISIVLFSIIPHLYLSLKCKTRMKAFKKQIPETLVLISNGMKAGYSFLQAINIVRHEMPSPMSEEFDRVLEETGLGVPIEAALKSMAARLKDEDFNLVVTAVIIQHTVGGNLAQVLRNIEHTIRERIKVKREIKVLTAQGKLSAVILLLLPFAAAAFIYFINRDYVVLLYTETLGRFMILTCFLLMILGTILIKRIVNIKV